MNINLLIGLFVLLMLSYVQFYTNYFEKYNLLVNVVLIFVGLATTIASVQLWENSTSYLYGAVYLLSGFVSVFIVVISSVKLFVFPEMQIRESRSLLRNRTNLSIPHKKFLIKTEDNVSISGFHIDQGRKKLIIVCHGAGRSKNILGDILLCEGLAYTYDVMAFDFRGHNESTGIFTGNGATSLDVKAVVNYARGLGYEKIGIVGRSLGAWSAIVNVAQFHNVDSLIAAAAPMEGLDDSAVTRKLPPWAMDLLGKIIARIIVGIRMGTIKGNISVASLIGEVSPIPLLLIYCENDTTIRMDKEDAKFLFSKANEPKKLVILEGVGHVLESRFTHQYYDIIRDWFLETL
jgi:pimeloyl-ACP methyl ester carboxylesterase